MTTHILPINVPWTSWEPHRLVLEKPDVKQVCPGVLEIVFKFTVMPDVTTPPDTGYKPRNTPPE